MPKRFSKRIVWLAVLLLLFTLPLSAQGFFDKISWFAEASILVFPDDNGTLSDPTPILPSLGLGAAHPFAKYFRLEFSLDFYLTHYGFSDILNRPIPNAIENRTSRVIGSLFALQAVGYFDITSFMNIRVFAGPAADLRIVLVAAGLHEQLDPMDDIRRQTDLVRSYFWSQGRWFMPVAGVGIDFTVNSRFKLGLDLRAWMPIYRLWTGEDLNPIDGWRFGGGVRLTFLKP